MKRKINQITNNLRSSQKSSIYERNREQYEFILNPDPGIRERDSFYIPDQDAQAALQRILTEPMDSATFFIGYPGIGKSSDLRACYHVRNGVPGLCNEWKTIILNCSFAGHFEPAMQSDSNRCTLELVKRMAAVCTALETALPDLQEHFRTPEGRREFLSFIQMTNPQSLENIRSLPIESVEDKLRLVQENEYFIYVASQLKYYLSRDKAPYSRILVVVDDIESQSELFQDQLVASCLRLFSCLRNFPAGWKGKRVYVNLLLSVRPATYHRLKTIPAVSACFMRKIYKQKCVDLIPYFQKKMELVPLELKKAQSEHWREVKNTHLTICSKFGNKYSNMILHLVDMDVRRTLQILEQILSNPVWVTKDLCTDKMSDSGYVINNITVIRAIACGRNLVYFNGEDQLIPNILVHNDTEDNSLLSLYVIAYFITHDAQFGEYCGFPVLRSDLMRDFSDVFPNIRELNRRLDTILNRFFQWRILVPTGPDYVWKQDSAKGETSCLALSPLGTELWNMLSADSVLLELYREDYYQEYPSQRPAAFQSSYDLMQENNQRAIFIELYRILIDLLEEEISLILETRKYGSLQKRNSIFGTRTMVEHLAAGVDRSIEFSGKQGDQDIQRLRAQFAAHLTSNL